MVGTQRQSGAMTPEIKIKKYVRILKIDAKAAGLSFFR
jgi:hypothetical protein